MSKILKKPSFKLIDFRKSNNFINTTLFIFLNYYI